MTTPLNLLPQPRSLLPAGGNFTLGSSKLILLEGDNLPALRFAAGRVQTALRARFSVDWQVIANRNIPAQLVALIARIDPEGAPHPQGYTLKISPEVITATAHDEAGIFYALSTLAQIIEQAALAGQVVLEGMEISDWPDFPVRGVMLDVSRDKVPSMETLFALVDRLAGWKINQLQLYTEHTFAYHNHPEVWAQASPLTGQEILDLDAFCRQRHIELVPNQNSFGHLHRWLMHPRYQNLAETINGFEMPWGYHEGTFSLCPVEPKSIEFLRGLFDELLPHFSSKMFNVGCDETFDIGQGRSREVCEQVGAGRVYLDFLLKIYQEVKARGRTMQFWGDIILRHPEFIPELPKDLIALEWGYEADHPFTGHCARFAEAGIPFYVCPGTSAWCSLAGRTSNALANLKSAAESGLRYGAGGYLITDWGDLGHWQPLPVSYLGLAAGAAYSWAWEANCSQDIATTISWYAFGDPTGNMGRVAYDLGEVYQVYGVPWENASLLFGALQRPLDKVRIIKGLNAEGFYRSLEAVDEAMAPLNSAFPEYPDRDLVRVEFGLAAQMLRHASWRGLYVLETDPLRKRVEARRLEADLRALMSDYQRVWLARNRPGGLADSLARFEKVRAEYPI